MIGASEVAGTFWEGTLLYFKDASHMEAFDYSGHYIYATTSDGKFIKNNIVRNYKCYNNWNKIVYFQIALAEDTGNINVLSLDPDCTIRPINYFKMIERIPQLGVWKDSSKILSCSERSIVIWDVDSIDRKPYKKFE